MKTIGLAYPQAVNVDRVSAKATQRFGFLGLLTQVDILCYCKFIKVIKPDV